jgi:hypothetical protein
LSSSSYAIRAARTASPPIRCGHFSLVCVTVETLRYAIANDLKTVNLSLTGEQSKLRWRPRRIEFRSALVRRDSLRSRLACGAYRAALSGRSPSQRLLRLPLQSRRWN